MAAKAAAAAGSNCRRVIMERPFSVFPVRHLFVALFPKVLTTTAVAAELRAKDVGDAEGIKTVLSTIEILPAPPLDPMLATILGPGEASILQLAKEWRISPL